jgi:hypothetical protein
VATAQIEEKIKINGYDFKSIADVEHRLGKWIRLALAPIRFE